MPEKKPSTVSLTVPAWINEKAVQEGRKQKRSRKAQLELILEAGAKALYGNTNTKDS